MLELVRETQQIGVPLILRPDRMLELLLKASSLPGYGHVQIVDSPIAKCTCIAQLYRHREFVFRPLVLQLTKFTNVLLALDAQSVVCTLGISLSLGHLRQGALINELLSLG